MEHDQLTISAEGAVTALQGELTIYQVATAQHELSRRLAEGDLALDLNRVSAVDTAGLQLLLALRKQAAAGGHSLSLSADGGPVAAAFTFLNLRGLLAGARGGEAVGIEEALLTFIEESRGLLEEMEEALLSLEERPDEPELLNAIFRAAHTIKGSAGLFGLEHVVRFAHRMESVLDRLRGGDLVAGPELVALLLECRDHSGLLIAAVADGVTEPTAELEAAAAALVGRLDAYLKPDSGICPVAPGGESEAPTPVEGEVESDRWHISLRCGDDLLRMGMDPLAILRYLEGLGSGMQVTLLDERLPPADRMEPEGCYLGFEVELRSDADKQAIAEAFEFVVEDCELHILPPHSRIDDYVRLIRALPEEDAYLGRLLVNAGALTEQELGQALAAQAAVPEAARRPVGETLVQARSVHREVVDAALEKQGEVREQRGAQAKYLRVRADKLDALINLVGELVIAGASASMVAQRKGDPETSEAAAAVSQIVEQIRAGALQLRMVQIGDTFNRFKRVVHDVSRELGKDIDLLIEGADTELDKTVVEKIGDPLTHLIRNAIDHGIEPLEKRRERGKPERGTVHLNAFHESGTIVIEVADDGGGLDRARLLAKAVDKGQVGVDQVLSDSEIDQLIFAPGLSTAAKVSDLSGRGVGMDVVRRNIESLRGSVEVASEPGRGTTIRIRLPLTLAIIEGFLMRVGEAHYVVPLETVVECIELPAGSRTAERDFIDLRGEVLPLVRLREYFDHRGERARRRNIIVVQYGAHKAGLVVDDLLGEFQTVIKPMGRLFEKVPGISGSTILGNGRVALILDVHALLRSVGQREESSYDSNLAATA